MAAYAAEDDEVVPDQHRDAMACEHAAEWSLAEKKEHAALLKNETWTLVRRPRGRNVIKGRWTYRIKEGSSHADKIRKARFVAKGYSQNPMTDYDADKLFSPVAKTDSIRVLCSIAAALGLHIHKFDVNAAFLHGELEEELYVEQPEGFIRKGEEDLVCRLRKTLYGLKQSPRKWNEKFNSFILENGLVQSTADPCLYFYFGETLNDMIGLGIWVDDGLVISKFESRAIALVRGLKQNFEMTSGPADVFIGLEITQDLANGRVHLTQHRYIQKLIQKFGMANCNPSKVPADPHSCLVKSPKAAAEGGNSNSTAYRALLGSLLYVAVMTRPDISYAVIAASRHCENPDKSHWKAAKLVLAYLAGTSRYGLCYSKTNVPNELTGYADSDFAGCKDTRRSTSGMLFSLNGAPVGWKSHLQKPVAQSTAEAEYYAAGHASKDIVWLRNVLSQLGLDQTGPTTLFCDNQSAMAMVHNPVFHERTKHIEVKYHYIRQVVESKKMSLEYVPSEDQLADILTKPLSAPAFELNRTRIGILEAPLEN